MKEELRNINWTNEFASKSISNSLKFLTSKIEELATKCVPTYQNTPTGTRDDSGKNIGLPTPQVFYLNTRSTKKR